VATSCPGRGITRPLTVAIAFLVASTAAIARQSSGDRAFEVVSIRRSTSDDTGGGWGERPGGRWGMVNASILALVRAAYPVESSEYIGGPDWLRTERYDVTAVGPPQTTRADIPQMLRRLLSERFRFNGHYETVERDVYNLVLARPDRKLPSGLRKVEIDCEARRAANLRGEKLPELPPPGSGASPCSIGMRYAETATIRSGGRTMAEFAQTLGGPAGRVVIDKTGLTGYYEFEMTFSPNPQAGGDEPSVFTALQEQLGLKLESARTNVRVFVVDEIERPTEN
jgi:uncharacterized protein (TIGR03435 family)